jgi:Zn-dependent alcohol dehydrogenase
VARVREDYPTLIANIVGSFGEGGLDYAFYCVGNPAVLNQCLQMLDWGGTAVAVGVPEFSATVPAQVTLLTHVERTLTGSRAGSHRPHWDIPLIVQAYKQGLIKLNELVSERYPLDDWETAVHDLHEGKLARGVLTVSAP